MVVQALWFWEIPHLVTACESLLPENLGKNSNKKTPCWIKQKSPNLRLCTQGSNLFLSRPQANIDKPTITKEVKR